MRRAIPILVVTLARLSASGPPVLTTARAVQALSIAEAKQGYHVRIRGIITYVNSPTGELFVQDETAGTFVFLKQTTSNVPLKLAQRVILDGTATPADFSPSVTNAFVTVLGAGKLPAPKHLQFDSLLACKEDGRWAQMEGVIRSGEVRGGGLSLNIATRGGTVLGLLPQYPDDWQHRLVDARITFQGVIGAIFNERRQSIGMRMFIPGIEHIQVDELPPPDPFSLPVSPAVKVGQYQPNVDLDRWMHVRATITGFEPGAGIYVSDGVGSLAIQAEMPPALRPGDQVDVVGFPGAVNGRPGLQDAICRLANAGPAIPALTVTTDDIFPDAIRTEPGGYALRASTRFDMKLIRIDSTLLQTSPAAGRRTFILRSGTREFTATLTGDDWKSWRDLGDGSRLRLTGLCLMQYDQYRRAESFRLVLRRPEDIVLISRPPWWNLRLTLWSLALVAFSFFATLAWVSVLRKQVSRQTLELRLANESLRWLSTQDALTSVANRRSFDETLERECENAERSGRPASLLMVDIDYFKILNDIKGHQEGDRCLAEVARTLVSVLRRSTDVVARYGGEEFAVILPDTSLEEAADLGDRMRQAVEVLSISHPGSPIGKKLSLSVGAATLNPGCSCSPSDLISAADKALYRAKKLGRNRTICIETPGTENQAALTGSVDSFRTI